MTKVRNFLFGSGVVLLLAAVIWKEIDPSDGKMPSDIGMMCFLSSLVTFFLSGLIWGVQKLVEKFNILVEWVEYFFDHHLHFGVSSTPPNPGGREQLTPH
jgi:hypothetical protein